METKGYSRNNAEYARWAGSENFVICCMLYEAGIDPMLVPDDGLSADGYETFVIDGDYKRVYVKGHAHRQFHKWEPGQEKIWEFYNGTN